MKIPGGNYRWLPDDPSTYILTVQRCDDGNRLLLMALYTGQRTVSSLLLLTINPAGVMMDGASGYLIKS